MLDAVLFRMFDRAQMKTKIAELAATGVFLGTSSWKYPGWRGLLYDEARYLYRGKVAESRFEKQCLRVRGLTPSGRIDAGRW